MRMYMYMCIHDIISFGSGTAGRKHCRSSAGNAHRNRKPNQFRGYPDLPYDGEHPESPSECCPQGAAGR